jgi:hypothetical protein
MNRGTEEHKSALEAIRGEWGQPKVVESKVYSTFLMSFRDSHRIRVPSVLFRRGTES